MANLDDVWQPAVLDPLLDFLAEYLPAPLYSLVINVFSHLIAALTAVSQLCLATLSNSPADWNVQALLPPIITLFAAYLALASLYRTTTWLARVMFWFLKWGTLFGVLMAGAGYLMGSAGNAIGNQGPVSMLAKVVANLFDDRSGSQSKRRIRQTKPRTRRPKAWDSFDLHKEWQFQQENEAPDETYEIQKFMDMIIDAAGQVFPGNWWNNLNGIGKDGEVAESESKHESPTSKRRKVGRSHSR